MSQQAKSQVYLARPLAILPCPEGFAVFEAYGAQRNLLDVLPDAQGLAEFISADFARCQARHEATVAREAQLRLPIDLPLDIELDL